jgi:hypothetical protein
MLLTASSVMTMAFTLRVKQPVQGSSLTSPSSHAPRRTLIYSLVAPRLPPDPPIPLMGAVPGSVVRPRALAIDGEIRINTLAPLSTITRLGNKDRVFSWSKSCRDVNGSSCFKSTRSGLRLKNCLCNSMLAAEGANSPPLCCPIVDFPLLGNNLGSTEGQEVALCWASLPQGWQAPSPGS